MSSPAYAQQLPSIQFDMYNIKQPQLIGIIAGCLVFIITISVVIYLLYASGTLGRAFAELAADGMEINYSVDKQGVIKSSVSSVRSVYENQPILYDNLVQARRKSMELTEELSSELVGNSVVLRKVDLLSENETIALYEACNGSAQYHESAYDPIARLWSWKDLSLRSSDRSAPYDTIKSFKEYIDDEVERQGVVVLAIIDKEYRKPIGLLTLSDIDRPNLSVRFGTVTVLLIYFSSGVYPIFLEYIWITPAFQGTRRAHEAVVVMLQELFSLGTPFLCISLLFIIYLFITS